MFRLFLFAIVATTFFYGTQGDSPIPAPNVKRSALDAQRHLRCPHRPIRCPDDKPIDCPFGFEQKDGCLICECRDPCEHHHCEHREKCVVLKKHDGEFEAQCERLRLKRGKEEPLTKAACLEPQKVGNCRKIQPRFFWNSATKACEQFIYGGCNANSNNFKTLEACEKLCKA